MTDKQIAVDPNFNAGMTFLIVVAAMTIKKVWDKTIDRFWNKAIETEYVTVDQCKEKREQIKLDTAFQISSSSEKVIGKIDALHKSVEDQVGNLSKSVETKMANLKENVATQTEGIDALKGSVTIAILENPDMSNEKKQEAIINLTSKRGKQ